MSTKLLVLLSMIFHTATFALLGLGSVYESQLLAFGSLVSLMIGLYFGKEVLERLELADERVRDLITEDDIDTFTDDDLHIVDILNADRD